MGYPSEAIAKIEEELIAPCGMNCSVCISFQAMQKELNRQGFKKKYGVLAVCPAIRTVTLIKNQFLFSRIITKEVLSL